MKNFEFLFSTLLNETLLHHCDNLSQLLQSKTMSAADGQKVGKMVIDIDTLQSIRNDESYELFWEKVLKCANSLDVDKAQLPHKHKTLDDVMMVNQVVILLIAQNPIIVRCIMKLLIAL